MARRPTGPEGCALPALLLLLAAAPRVAAVAIQGLALDPYELSEAFKGRDFFDNFEFWTDKDPSKGAVRYVGRGEAEGAGLVRAQDDAVYIGADTDTVAQEGEGRRSVRIQSRNAYNAGLFVARARHVPTGCGLWPALWMYGEDPAHPWPKWGEFDIAESVHESAQAMTTLHTTSRCTQRGVVAGTDFTGTWARGSPNPAAVDCDVDAMGQYSNQGCSQLGTPGSYGAGFNSNGGGTYAAEWEPDMGYIRTWFWPAGSEPADVQQGRPDPAAWGQPHSYFDLGAEACPSGHFVNMNLVVNLNFCGDLGDASWGDKCPELASQMTCSQYVERHPSKFAEAFWSFASIEVYQRPGLLLSGRERTVYPSNPAEELRRRISVALGLLAAGAGIFGIFVVTRVEIAKHGKGDGIDAEDGPFSGLRGLHLVTPAEGLRAVTDCLGGAAVGATPTPSRPAAASWDATASRSRTSTLESITDPNTPFIGGRSRTP